MTNRSLKEALKKKVWGTVALVLVDIKLKLLNQLFKVFLIYFLIIFFIPLNLAHYYV